MGVRQIDADSGSHLHTHERVGPSDNHPTFGEFGCVRLPQVTQGSVIHAF